MATATPVTPASCPKRSPWGPVQNSEQLLPGLFVVDTSSHGGIWLSPSHVKRAKAVMSAIAPEWTPFTDSWSWLEEDCDWVVAALSFPTGFSVKAVAYAMRAVAGQDYYRADPVKLAAFWQSFAGLAVVARANDLTPQ